MLVATAILVGSIGRIVIGSLTDRFGGRTMFIAVSLASIVPVLAVGAAGAAGSYPMLLVCGFFLGIAGMIFAVGIPFANNWYEAARRGYQVLFRTTQRLLAEMQADSSQRAERILRRAVAVDLLILDDFAFRSLKRGGRLLTCLPRTSGESFPVITRIGR
jgi:hypothetical protein